LRKCLKKTRTFYTATTAVALVLSVFCSCCRRARGGGRVSERSSNTTTTLLLLLQFSHHQEKKQKVQIYTKFTSENARTNTESDVDGDV